MRRTYVQAPDKNEKAIPDEADLRLDPDIVQKVLVAARAAAPEKLASLTAATRLIELGLDSIKQFEIIGRIEEAFAIRIPDRELWNLDTCGDIARAVQRQVQGKDSATDTTAR